MIFIYSLIFGLVIMLMWNCTGNYLAWTLFHYALPNMNYWQGICLAFILLVIALMINVYNDNVESD